MIHLSYSSIDAWVCNLLLGNIFKQVGNILLLRTFKNMFSKDGWFGDLKGVDNMSLLGTEDILF